ncbi:MAG TPA: DUF58 domain-containing protein [Gammaproteobacteria bacterium]|nr:DUF58 domain-containing protein [Gammaproteobacteria bacterium]
MRAPWPCRILRGQVFILPTRFGWLGVATTLVLLLLGLNYQNAPIFLLAFVFAALGPVSMVVTHRHLQGLELGAPTVAPVFAGDPIRVRVPVVNASGRRRRALIAFADEAVGPALDLAPGADGCFELVLPARERGRHRLRGLGIASSEPFGAFRAWARFAGANLECIVYPRPASRAPLPGGDADKLGGMRAADQPEDFVGIAAYRPGDRPGQIAWRAYARGGEIERKEFGGLGASSRWFDFDSLPELLAELRLQVLARWVLDAERSGAVVYGLRLQAFRLSPARGGEHLDACLRALALYPGPYDA